MLATFGIREPGGVASPRPGAMAANAERAP